MVAGASTAGACATDAGPLGGGGAAATGGGVNYGTGGSGTGLTGNGGTQGGGNTSVGGSQGGTVSGYTFVGTVTPAPGQSVIPVPSTFLSCSSPAPADGGGAACISANCVPEATASGLMSASQQALLGKCSDGTSYCVPDDFIATLGKFELKTCASVSGFEGRCISTCIPQVERLAYALPQDVCAPSERCAPCYYPWPVNTSADGGGGSDQTGACTAGAGDSPKQPKQTFPLCGSGQGLCVPSSLVPANLLAAVPKDTCATGQLCAPMDKVKDLSFKYPTCTGGLGNGACVPKYLALYAGGDPVSQIAAAAFAACNGMTGVVGTLPPGNDWVCAPCINPLNSKPTGACE